MTKINKLGKSTFVIAILSFLLVAVLAFGGTYAYFSAQTATVSGTITTGHLRIGPITGDAVDDVETTSLTLHETIAQPNQTIMNDAFSAQVTSNITYYTRVKFTVHVKTAGHDHVTTDANGQGITCSDKFESALEALVIGTEGNVENDNAGGTYGKWLAGDDSATTATATEATTSKYFYKLAPTVPTLTNLDPVPNTEQFTIVAKVKPIIGTTSGSAEGCEYWMDAEITISVSFEVLQAEYLFASEDNDNDDENGSPTDAITFTTGEEAEDVWTKALTGAEGTNPNPAN